MAGNVKLTVQLQAQDRATKVIRATHKANEQLVQSMIKAGTAQTRLGAKVALAINRQHKYRAAIVRTADAASKWGTRLTSMRAAVSALAGAMAVRAFSDFVVAGEKAGNIAIRFAQAVPDATRALGAAQRATAGLVEETDLQVVMNRFARLGVPIEQTTRLLDLSTKAAIDQGRGVLEVAKVIESSLKGRTTGLVEIGVNLDKITGLTAAYAAETGVAVGELDEMDRRLKVALPAALRALGEQFDGVDLSEFNLQMQQSRTTFGDFVSDVQTFVAEGWGDLLSSALSPGSLPEMVADFAAASAEFERVSAWRAKFKDGTRAADQMGEAMRDAAGDAGKALEGIRRAIAGLKPEELIASFNRLRPSMVGLTRAAREQIRELYGLAEAYAAVRQASANAFVNSAKALPGIAKTVGTGLMSIASKFGLAIKAGIGKTKRKGRGGGGGGGRAAAAAAQLAELDRLSALRRQVVAMQAQDELERARLKHQDALIKLRNEAATIGNDENRREAITLARQQAQLAFLKERETITAKRQQAQADASKAFEAARLSLRIAQATTEQEVIRLELMQRIAEIEASSVNAQTQALMIEEARTEAAARRAQIEAQNRDEMIGAFAGGFSSAFADGAEIMGRLDQNLAQLGRPERFQNISAGFAALSAGVGPAIESFAELGKSSMSSGDKVASGVAAGLGAIGPAVAGFVGGVKEQAMVMGAFEAAMAIATAFTNTAEAISHGIAAAMFFAMAGVASAQPTTPATTAPTGGTGVGFSGGGGSGEPGTVVVNIGEGMVFGRPSEIGRAVAQRMASMSGTGMEATAF